MLGSRLSAARAAVWLLLPLQSIGLRAALPSCDHGRCGWHGGKLTTILLVRFATAKKMHFGANTLMIANAV